MRITARNESERSMTSVEVHGHCNPKFQTVADRFARNFEEFDEVGASVAVTVEGEAVVDLWAGHADAERTRPWERDTIVNTWSSTKGVTATAAHVLVDRGLLDVDAPVAEYWPEFAQAGKVTLPVRYLLTHQAGLAAWEGDHPRETTLDWHAATAALAATKPEWEPGSGNGYHAVTFGWLVGEVVRRIAGTSTFREALRELVTRPLDADFHVGLSESAFARVADILRERATVAPNAAPPDRSSLRFRAFAPLGRIDPNSADWRRAEIPGANGHGNARSLARIYAPLANGGTIHGLRLMAPETIEQAAKLQVSSEDLVLGGLTHRTLGYMLPFAERGDVRPPTAFGHGGAGGSQGFADPAARVSFAYVMNQMSGAGGVSGALDPRGQALCKALYDAL